MKGYLVDDANGRRVNKSLWDSKKEAVDFLKLKYREGERAAEGPYLKDYLDGFIFVSEKEMKEAVREYGPRKMNYWT